MSLELNNEVVSIITPVFNGELFIDKCFECIEQQTYSNIEWVVINDGSVDDSLAKLYQLQIKYSNLTIIDQKNAGAAEARRAGAKQAKGDYIVYLDIDDAISGDAIELAVKKLTPATDIVLFKQLKVANGQTVPFDMFTESWPQTGEAVFKACIDGWGAHSFGLYRKSIFLAAYSNLDEFSNLSKTYKDELLTRMIFSQARLIDYCAGIYFYDLNDASVSKKFNPDYYLIANNVHALNQYLKSKNKPIDIERMYCRLFFDILGRYIRWRKQITNRQAWQDTLAKLAKHVSLTKECNLSIEKSDYKKMLPRLLLLTAYKMYALIRKA